MIKITVIVPVYNVETVIKNSLSSLETQTYQNFEVLIIDDGSTDNTKQVIKKYLNKNQTWKYFFKPNGNWGSVINFVLKNNLINGDYVTILDADDWLANDAIEKVTLKIIEDSQIDLIISKITLKFRKKQFNFPVILSKKSRYLKSNYARTPFSTPHGKFYQTSLFKKLMPLRENISYQDAVLYNQLVSHAQKIYYLNQPLATWWMTRPQNSTQALWDKARINIWLDNIESIVKICFNDAEINSYALMYLWELSRKVKKTQITRKIKLNLKDVKFLWIPRYIRFFIPIKFYFKFKVRHLLVK